MFTIKSKSNDNGQIYYLCKGWGSKPPMWTNKEGLKPEYLYHRKQDAQASLKKLLKVMSEYALDDHKLVKIEGDTEQIIGVCEISLINYWTSNYNVTVKSK